MRTDLDGGDQKAHVPSVSLASIADDKQGRVSLALEYAVMKSFSLKRDAVTTSGVGVSVTLAKTRGRNTFGDILDIAGKTLALLPIPANPYTPVAGQFLKFANDSIDKATANDNQNLIAQLSLNFADHPIADIKACHSAGYESTGGIAVLLSTGQEGATLIPIEDADKKFCFSYSSESVFSLVALERPTSGTCPTDLTQYSEVPNDYVLFILNGEAGPRASRNLTLAQRAESQKRCQFFQIPNSMCE